MLLYSLLFREEAAMVEGLWGQSPTFQTEHRIGPVKSADADLRLIVQTSYG